VQVVSAETDLLDRFDLVVDRDTEPVDLDEVLLDALDKIVERRLLRQKDQSHEAA